MPNKHYTVTFQPFALKINADHGEAVLQVARRAGIHINASCGGAGVCGKCRVTVENGDVSGGISEKLSSDDISAGVRQACTALVESDLTVSLPEDYILDGDLLTGESARKHRATPVEFDVQTLQKKGVFLPPVEKFFIELPLPSANDNMSDAGRLSRALAEQYSERGLHIGLSMLRKLRRICREDNFRLTATLSRPVGKKAKTQLVNLQSGNWTDRNYGLAVDIGTTTVYCQLIDLHTGENLGMNGNYNGQLSYGEDVISRIIYAEKPEGLVKMQEIVVATINNGIESILQESRIRREEITCITLAGNTVMTHLFLSLEPHNIRRSPYVPVSTLFPPIRATDLGLQLPDYAIALVFPAVSSYVGGDIVAGVMGAGMHLSDELTLFIDVGTNAEIVIGNREWMVCAACSAGPAFEGGGITHGMRAAPGAIDDFAIHPRTLNPMNRTIDNKPPRGICGSGLLVIIATLLEHGIIDARGKFNRDIHHHRLREGRSGFEFVLAGRDETDVGHDIVLNEVDIGNFIRAKGAIFAGANTLIEEIGLSLEEIDRVILAGGFGSYLDLDAAITVGLLPELPAEKVLYAGNGSLLGCRMSSLSNHIRLDVLKVIQKMTSFELSEVPAFQNHFTASLFLPHTDMQLFPLVAEKISERKIDLEQIKQDD